MTDQIWRLHIGNGPLIATAIHDGHHVRQELSQHLALSDQDRLREEDPFTGGWTQFAPTRLVGMRSRFEVDLNRPREKAVYQSPEDAWGLRVWHDTLPTAKIERSLAEYDAFYDAARDLFQEISDQYGYFIVFDLHSYNHHRKGPDSPYAAAESNPQMNIGTGSVNRQRWGHVVDGFIESLSAYEFPNGNLDVRENVKFRGGRWSSWINENFPETGLAIAIEVKKFFMDEWTGEPNRQCISDIGLALKSTVPGVLDALSKKRG
jgi:N-formylglutamate deformylase